MVWGKHAKGVVLPFSYHFSADWEVYTHYALKSSDTVKQCALGSACDFSIGVAAHGPFRFGT